MTILNMKDKVMWQLARNVEQLAGCDVKFEHVYSIVDATFKTRTEANGVVVAHSIDEEDFAHLPRLEQHAQEIAGKLKGDAK